MKRKKYHPDYWDDIPDDWKAVIDQLYREEYNSDQRETRRHQSLNKLMEYDDFLIEPKTLDPLEILMQREQDENIPAFKGLTVYQRRIAVKFYIDGKKQYEIANEETVSPMAISKLLKKIKTKISKNLPQRV